MNLYISSPPMGACALRPQCTPQFQFRPSSCDAACSDMVKTRKPTKGLNFETTKKCLPIISAALGQVPSATTVAGVYSLSLYQPSIYHGKEPFLLIPLMVGLIATWAALKWP